MSHPARSIYAAALYVIILGSGLVIVPNLVLSVFGLPQTDEVWIRLLGMMTIFIGVFQWHIAHAELRDLFYLTVILRLSVVGFVGAFVVLGLAAPVFLLITPVDVLGALWTWFALRREPKLATT